MRIAAVGFSGDVSAGVGHSAATGDHGMPGPGQAANAGCKLPKCLRAYHQAGAAEIEVGSFVPAQLLPQLADTAELVAYARSLPDLTVTVLAPNKRGLEAAVKSGAHKVSIPFSMSESHSIKNVRKNHPQMLEEVRSCIEFLRELPRDQRPVFEVSLSTAFGCTIEGEVPEDKVLRLAEKVVALGADEVCLCDTTGLANPVQLARLLEAAWANCERDKKDSVHLHNTRGQGIANALRAVELGITGTCQPLSDSHQKDNIYFT